MHSAHSLTRRLRKPFGLAADPSYRAALFVANRHGLISESTRTKYKLGNIAKAETILCSCSAGGGLTKDQEVFLAGALASGVVARLAELLERPERLAESQFHVDARGRAIRIFADFDNASLGLEIFAGGHPDGAARILDGAKLVEALAD